MAIERESRPSPDLGAAPEASRMPEGEEPPPRGVRTMAAVRWVILALSGLTAAGVWWSYASSAQSPASASSLHATHHCPMHPQITSTQAGECPICHMTLEPIPKRNAAPGGGTSAGDGGASTSIPSGTAPITLAPDRMHAIGVRTTIVSEGKVAQPLRVSAVVTATEQGAAEVHVRAAGFVERLRVTETGVRVARQQVLFTYYSPEIYQAQSELLAMLQWPAADARAAAPAAARRKLELLGMAPADIERVAKTGELLREVPVYAPQAGHVIKKGVVAGAYVTPEMTLYEIQDLSRVYIIADVFTRDVLHLQRGTRGRFTANQRGAAIDVRIDLIYPTLDAEARTSRVRMQVQDARGAELRPGEYGSVEFATPARKTMTVPRDAIVDTGLATYVFVVEGEGTLSPQAVVLAGEVGDDVAIVSGLAVGDRVVSGATFLIDAESRLQAASARAAAGRP